MPDQTSESPLKAALRLGPIQIVVLAIVALIAIAAAVVTAVRPQTLSFDTYSTVVIPQLVAALGILGIGKGLHLGLAGRTEQKILGDMPDILKAIEHGQVAAAMAAVAQDLELERPLEPGERLPTWDEEQENPPTADTALPPLPDEPPSNHPDLPPGAGLAGDPEPEPGPSEEEIAGARRILAIAQQQPTDEDIAVARDVLRRAQA